MFDHNMSTPDYHSCQALIRVEYLLEPSADKGCLHTLGRVGVRVLSVVNLFGAKASRKVNQFVEFPNGHKRAAGQMQMRSGCGKCVVFVYCER